MPPPTKDPTSGSALVDMTTSRLPGHSAIADGTSCGAESKDRLSSTTKNICPTIAEIMRPRSATVGLRGALPLAPGTLRTDSAGGTLLAQSVCSRILNINVMWYENENNFRINSIPMIVAKVHHSYRGVLGM